MESALQWLALSRAPQVGRFRLAELMKVCPDPADLTQFSPAELALVNGWTVAAAKSLLDARHDAEAHRQAVLELKRTEAAGLRLVLLTDPDYPYRLVHIDTPPPFLWWAGPWTPDDRPVIAVIGTRKPTPYGLSVAERFGRDLASAGAVVVSGMARGIDAAAHRGALAVGGVTAAVLGSGADICYPREAARLYQRMRETGAILSEQPPGTEPLAPFFPERNRIISGLAHAVVVVEAGEKSGTSITVDRAMHQGREVFAVPGPITSPMSEGPHLKIREGATLVMRASQVLEALGFGPSERRSTPLLVRDLTAGESALLGWMGQEPRWAGDLAEASGLEAREVQAVLTLLEIKGLIRQLPGGQYMRVG
jgi:DNA processing protein